MRRSSARWQVFPVMIALIFLAGCTPPDRWTVFDPPPAKVLSINAAELPSSSLDLDVPAQIPATTRHDRQTRGSLELSLEEAVMLALHNNPDLRVRQFDPIITGTFEQIERGAFDPEFFAEAEYFEERANEVARSTGSQFSVEGSDRDASAGLRQELPSGTALEAAITHRRTISDRAPEQQRARVGLSVTQSLLRGLGPRVNLARVRQAELDTAISRHELHGFVETLLADTEIAYWELVFAEKEIAIFEQSLEFARKQRDETALRVEVGTLAEIECAAARAEVARRKQGLINARARLKERRLRLLRLLTPGPFGNFEREVTASGYPSLDSSASADVSSNIAARLELAQQLRSDLREAQMRSEQRRLETIVTRNGVLPRLDFFITMGRSGFADTFSDSFREIEGSNYDLSAGLRLSSIIGNRAAKARDLAATSSRRQANEAVANLRQLIELDVRLAANEVQRTLQQIEASTTTRELEEKALQAELERFDVGAGTSLLVARAQRDLLASQIAEVRAVIDYRRAVVQLYQAEGSLTARRGIATHNLD